MKAVFLNGHGGNEVVQVGERPMPQRKQGEVLVRMRAATLNRVDLYMRDSGAGIRHQLPLIMGVDGAGVIEEVDAQEQLLKPGQRVVLYSGVTCGRCEFCQHGEPVLCTSMQTLGEHCDGTLAEYISVPAGNVFPIPEGLSFEEAAALGVNYLTAWRMLFTKAQLKPWETVLVFGIGGGVSLAGMQLAKAAGARVIVTSREQHKIDRALELGADAGICSSTEDVQKRVMELTGGRGVDIVFENVGEAVWSTALKSLIRGGRIVTCGATTGDQPGADLRRLFVRQLQIFGSSLGNLGEFHDLLQFVQRTGLRPIVDSRFALGDVHAALNRLESGQHFGKIALHLGDA